MMDLVKLKDLVTSMHQGINTVADKVEYQNTGKPIIQSKNITSGLLDLDDVRYLSEEDYCKYYEKYRPTKGDLLFCNIGTIGKSLVIEDDIDFLIAWNLFVIKLNKKILPEYLKYYFEYLTGKKYFNKLLTGGTVKFINKKSLGEIKIPLAKLEKQSEIVEVLKKVEETIIKRQSQITALDELTQSLFLEMFGDPIVNNNKYPKRPLSDFGEIITGNTPSRKEPEYYGDYIEWIKSDNINTPYHYLTRADEFLSEKGLEKGRLVPENSILVTCIAGSKSCIGNAAIADRPVTFNQQINAVIPKGNPYFLYTQFLVGKKLIQQASTDGMKGLVSKGAFQKVEFIAPPLKIQEEFGEKFLAIQHNKQQLLKSLNQIENLYNSLLQKAFKGELFQD